jgi:Caudovirus prohead serine protease
MGIVDGNLQALTQFPAEGTSEQSDECYRLIKENVVTGTSIGFMARSWEPLDREKPYMGLRFTSTELVELSYVSVPANRDAAIIAKSLAARDYARMTSSTPAPSTLSYAGDLRHRRALLHWEHPDVELATALAAADPATREGRAAIVAAHRRFGERLKRR